MRASRLFILGMLTRHGEMHGHQIRRAAQIDRTELWADIKPGALYGALHRMAAEGVIVSVRTEQEGNRPARTVYAITDEGREEFASYRDEVFRDARLRPDPFDLALQQSAGELSESDLREMVGGRLQALTTQHATFERLWIEAAPFLTAAERLSFQHTLRRLALEIEWHRDIIDQLPLLAADPPSGRTVAESHPTGGKDDA
jgi:DNA-binding PadR family transcriptional regulator